jgi:hypothetical protein
MPDEPANRPEFTQHPLVEALVPDPAAGVRPTTVLVGFLGNSTSGDRRRLYLTPTLDEWVELPVDEILHTRDLPEEQGTQVWVRQDLPLDYRRQSQRSVEAQFVSGPISQRFLGGAAATTGRRLPMMLPTGFPDGGNCPLPTEIGPRCPTNVPLRCPTEFGPRCPTTTTPTDCVLWDEHADRLPALWDEHADRLPALWDEHADRLPALWHEGRLGLPAVPNGNASLSLGGVTALPHECDPVSQSARTVRILTST